MLSKPGFILFDSQSFLEIAGGNDYLSKLPGSTSSKLLLYDLVFASYLDCKNRKEI